MEATLTVSKEHATPAEVVPRQNSATTHAAAPLAYASAALPPASRARHRKWHKTDTLARPARILDSCWIVAPLWPQVVLRAQGI